jgi:sec-independent protein translocase protein TatC
MTSALRKPDWDDEPEHDEPHSGAMPFLEHLDEFRRRLIYSVIAIAAAFAVALVWSDAISAFIFQPILKFLPDGQKFLSTNPPGVFLLKFRMSAIAGTMIASPFVMWQVWRFVAPGLYRDEKRVAIPFVLLSSSLFIAGALFSHYVVFPMTMQFFASFSSDIVEIKPEIEATFGIYMQLLFAFALAFQLPAVVMMLARLRLVTARFLIRHTKYAVLAIFVAAALLTPGGDAYVQLLMALPMLGLFVLSIVLAWAVAPK